MTGGYGRKCDVRVQYYDCVHTLAPNRKFIRHSYLCTSTCARKGTYQFDCHGVVTSCRLAQGSLAICILLWVRGRVHFCVAVHACGTHEREYALFEPLSFFAHASKHTLAHTIRHAHAHSLDEFQEHTQIKCTLFTSAPASRRLSSIGVFSHEAAINRGVAPVRV